MESWNGSNAAVNRDRKFSLCDRDDEGPTIHESKPTRTLIAWSLKALGKARMPRAVGKKSIVQETALLNADVIKFIGWAGAGRKSLCMHAT